MDQDIDLLTQPSMTELIREFKEGPLPLMNAGLFPMQPIEGRIATWDIEKVKRDIPVFTGPQGAALPRETEVIDVQESRMLRWFQSTQIKGGTLIGLRRPGTTQFQQIAEDDVGKKTRSLRRARDRAMEFTIARALTGTIDITLNGLAHNISMAFDPSHILTIGSGIPLAWDDPAADITIDLSKIKVLPMEDAGYPIWRAYTSPEVMEAMIRNDFVQTYFASTNHGSDFMREGKIGRFWGIDWFEYSATFKPDGGSPTRYIDKRKIVFVPEPDGEWSELQTGTDVIPADDRRDVQEVSGMYSYTKINDNPAGITVFAGDNWLPVIKIPDAVVVATVLN